MEDRGDIQLSTEDLVGLCEEVYKKFGTVFRRCTGLEQIRKIKENTR